MASSATHWLKKRINMAPVATLAGSAGLGQVILLIATPLLSRLYTPDQFAVFSVFSALGAVLVVLPAIRLELCVPIEPDEALARRTATAALQSAIVFSLLGTFAILALSPIIVAKFSDNWGVSGWVWLLPLAASSTAALAVMNQWAVRVRAYRAISARNISRNLVMAVLQLLIGLVWDSAGGLIAGFIAANVVACVSMFISLHLNFSDVLLGFREWSSIVAKWWRFSVRMVFSGFLNLAGVQLPIVAFASFYTAGDTGQLAMAQRVLALPIAVIGMAVGQVFLADFSSTVRAGRDGHRIFVTSTLRLFAVGVLVVVGAVFLGPVLIPLLLGPQWGLAGEYIAVMSVGIAAQLIASPLSQVLIVLELLHIQIAWDLGRLIAVVGSVAVMGQLGVESMHAVLALSGITFATYAIQWLTCYVAISSRRRAIRRSTDELGGSLRS